ncbi:MAG: patatin-like phospholipase family protein [Acidimicrobiia bacterium]
MATASGDERPVAIVLGGGGNLGAVQVGMLRALADAGVTPDMIFGCSVGALNGAAFAISPTTAGVDALEGIWRGALGARLMPSGWWPTAVGLTRRGDSLQDPAALRRLIRDAPVSRFEEFAVPFECVATAVDDAREVWFGSGDIEAPIMASCAVPVVYPAVWIDGVRYRDGAIVNEVPISRAVERGARTIYVLHVGAQDRPRRPARRPLDVAVEAYWVARRNRFVREMDTLPEGVKAVVLPTGPAVGLRFHDFTRTGQLMAQAYRASRALLDLPLPASGNHRQDLP